MHCNLVLYRQGRSSLARQLSYLPARNIKTKNDWAALRLFVEMLEEVLSWGLLPKLVTGDTWYASVFNLKMCKKYGLDACFAVEKDRQISTEKGQYQRADEAEIPVDGHELT